MNQNVVEAIMREQQIAYILTDRALRITEVNGQIVGCDLATAYIGMLLFDLFPELIGYEQVLQAILDGQLPRWQLEWVNRETAAGETVYLAIKECPLHSATGEIVGLIHLVEDITQRGEMMQRTVQRNSELSLLRVKLKERNEQLERMNAQLRQETAKRVQANQVLRKNEAKYRSLVESTNAVPWKMELTSTRFTYMGSQIEQVLGYPTETWVDRKSWADRLHAEDYQKAVTYSNQAIQRGEDHDFEYRAIAADGRVVWIRDSVSVVMGDRGPKELVGFMFDISEHKRVQQIKAALAEKEVLLREVHHRVKNNMQALIYLIDMQAETITNPTALDTFGDLQRRIRAMTLIHEKLYQAPDLAQVDFADYLQELTSNLVYTLGSARQVVQHIETADLSLNINLAIPCGMIVNELVTNALKHAFPTNYEIERPEIRVEFGLREGEYVLVVSDNGIGLSQDLDWRTTQTLGLKLVNVWVRRQLGGSIELDTQSGSTFKIRFVNRKQRGRFHA